MSESRRFMLFAILAFLFVATPSINAGWLQEDVAVCTDGNVQQNPTITPNGQGGTFVVWEDLNMTYMWISSIHMQKFDADGKALWPMNGITVSPTRSSYGSIIPDGAGGAYLAYQTDSTMSVIFDCPVEQTLIMIERIDGNGSILWKKAINPYKATNWTNAIYENNAHLFPDGSGGAILTWETEESCSDVPIMCVHPCDSRAFIQRIDPDGNRLWGLNPVRVSLSTFWENTSSIVQDESGNIIIVWPDPRNWATTGSDIYAQKMDLSGNRLWGPTGVPVFVSASTQDCPRVAPDGAGGAFVTWLDWRSNIHIYAQRLDSSGSVLWNPDGISVCMTDGAKNEIGIVPDAPRSSVIYWTSPVNDRATLFAQRLDASGNPLWTTNGRQLSDGLNPCQDVQAMSDGEGGAILAWERVVPQPPHGTIRGLWGFSSRDIYAVGDNGLIIHYNGVKWTLMTSPTLNTLRHVWGAATNDVYAIGVDNTVIHYDGTSWRLASHPAMEPYGIWGAAANDIWIVGYHDVLLHYDGSSWTKLNLAWGCYFTAVSGTASNNVYVTGGYNTTGAGFVAHYDGTSWQKTDITNGAPRGVWAGPRNQVFATSPSGVLNVNEGAGWQTVDLGMKRAGYGIWGSDSSNVYAVYDVGNVVHWNGSGATSEHVAMDTIFDVWGTSGSDIWICGKPHLIRHLVGSTWVTQNQLDTDILLSKVDSTGTALWNDVGAQATISRDYQESPSLAADGSGNMLLAWSDSRNANWDIYARKVSISRGPIVATELMSFTAQRLDDGVKVSWQLSQYTEGATFTLSRADGGQDAGWRVITPAIARDRLSFSFVDSAVVAGSSYRYRVQVSDERGSRALFETDTIILPPLPLTLRQNFPNPFNPSTTIRYYVPGKCRVRLEVYDVSGRLVARLVDRDQPPGHYDVEWNGRDNLGKQAASGIYFCRLQAGKNVRSRKMVLVR